MAANPTPEDDDVLMALAGDMAAGCDQHEVALGIGQNTAARMRAAMAAAVAARAAAGEAAVVFSEATQAHRQADRAAGALLTAARLRMVHLFGGRFDAHWEEAGFPDGWTRVPRTQDKRYALVNRLKAYLAAHPEVESGDLGVTAAAFSALAASLSAARGAMHRAKSAKLEAEAAAEAAFRMVRKRVRGLIDELDLLMPDTDARYLQFGLNIPAHPSMPGGIAGLKVERLTADSVLCVWTRGPRSTGTRLVMQREGVDAEFVSQGSTTGLEKRVAGLVAGQSVHFQAIPHNAAGDGPPSPVVTVVVG